MIASEGFNSLRETAHQETCARHLRTLGANTDDCTQHTEEQHNDADGHEQFRERESRPRTECE